MRNCHLGNWCVPSNSPGLWIVSFHEKKLIEMMQNFPNRKQPYRNTCMSRTSGERSTDVSTCAQLHGWLQEAQHASLVLKETGNSLMIQILCIT